MADRDVVVNLTARDTVSAAAAQAAQSIAGLAGTFPGLTSAMKGPGDAGKQLGDTLTQAFQDPIGAAGDLASAIGDVLGTALGALGPIGEGVALGLGALAAASVALEATVFALADSAAHAGEEVEGFSLKTGIAVENVGPLQFAVEAAGGSLDTLSAIFRGIDMKQATDQGGKFSAALADMGINAEAFKAADPETKLLMLSDAMQKGTAGGNLMNDMLAIGGRQMVAQIPVIEKMNVGLLQTGAALGVAWTPTQTEQAKTFTLGLNTMELGIENIGIKIGQALLPAMSEMMTSFATSPAFINAVTLATQGLSTGLSALIQVAAPIGAFVIKDIVGPLAKVGVTLEALHLATDGLTGDQKAIKADGEALQFFTQIAADATPIADGLYNAGMGMVKGLDALAAGATTTGHAFTAGINLPMVSAATATDDLAKKQKALETAMADLDIEIGNATTAGQDLSQVTETFGKKAHDAMNEAVALGIPLSEIPGNVDSINTSFNNSVIAEAIAKANEQMLKLGLSTDLARVKSDQAADDASWKSIGKDIANMSVLSGQWELAFGSASDQAGIKATQFHDTMTAKVTQAFNDGSISAEDYAAALAEIDQLQGKMVSDASWSQWNKDISGIETDLSALASVSSGTFKTVVSDIGTGITAVTDLAEGNWAGAIAGFISLGASIWNSVFGLNATQTALQNLGITVQDQTFGDPWFASQTEELKELQGQATLTKGTVDDLFAGIAVGGTQGAAATTTLNGLVTTFTTQASTTGGVWSAQFQTLIGESQHLGDNIDSITKALASQVASATTGLNTALGVTTSAYTAATSDQSVISDPTATVAAVATATADLQKQQGIIDATQVHSQGQASAVASSLVGIAQANEKAGMSFVDAFKAEEPAIQGLQTQLTKTGYTGGASFTFLGDEVKLATGAISGPALTAVEGYTQGVVGLANAGMLTKSSFAGLESQIGTTYQTLVTQGATGQEALAALQPDLQSAWELEQQYGYTTDAATQSLIDQGVQAGIVGEKQKDPMTQLIDVMGDVDKTLKSIASDMTGPGGLTDAAAQAAGDMQKSFDSVTGPSVTLNTGSGSGPPHLAAGAFVPGPMLAVVGDSPGGEWVIPSQGLGTNYSPLSSFGSGGGSSSDSSMQALLAEVQGLRSDVQGMRRDVRTHIPKAVRDGVLLAG